MVHTKFLLRAIFISTALLALLLPACDNAGNAGNTVAPGARESVVGKVIRFKKGGESEPYRASGWSATEAEFTWSDGTSAKLALPINKDAAGLTLKVTAAALTGPNLPFQPVEVFVNDQKIADWQVANTADFSADVPAELTKTGVLNVEFRTPKATSPKALGQSEDPRVLGIAVHTISVMGPA